MVVWRVRRNIFLVLFEFFFSSFLFSFSSARSVKNWLLLLVVGSICAISLLMSPQPLTQPHLFVPFYFFLLFPLSLCSPLFLCVCVLISLLEPACGATVMLVESTGKTVNRYS